MVKYEGRQPVQISKIIGLIIYLTFIIISFLTIRAKTNLFGDEVFSYGLANHSEGGLDMAVKDGYTYIPASDPYLNYVSVQDNRFDYKTVWSNQAADVHPPLYYALLHTICSFFPGSYSRWYAGGINIVFGVLTIFYFRKIVYKVFEKDGSEADFNVNLLSFVLALSPGIISNAAFFRMYVIAMFWITYISFYIVDIIMDDREDMGMDICLKLFLGIFAGALTHYYCIIFSVALCFCFTVYLILRRKHLILYKLIGVGIVSGSASLAVFPAMISHMFSGYRGQEASRNLLNFSDMGSRLKIFYNIMDSQMFGGTLGRLVIFILFFSLYPLFRLVIKFSCGILNSRGNTDSQECANNDMCKESHQLKWGADISAALLLLISCGIYFMFVAKAASFTTERYIYPIYAVVFLSVYVILFELLKRIMKREYLYIAKVAAAGWMLIQFSQYTGLSEAYASDAEKMKVFQSLNGIDCVCVYEGAWELPSLLYEVMNYESIVFLSYENLEEIYGLDTLKKDRFVLIVSDNTGRRREDVADMIINWEPAFVDYKEVGRQSYSTTYLLEK